jgi:chaperonin GroEL (HSP60 family)
VRKILENAGKSDHEVRQTLLALSDPARPQNEVCDLVTDTFGDAVEKGLLDSVPAVVEALGNALSIASLLGTLGGCVVFPRDREAEAKESSDTYDFLESANAADERP